MCPPYSEGKHGQCSTTMVEQTVFQRRRGGQVHTRLAAMEDTDLLTITALESERSTVQLVSSFPYERLSRTPNSCGSPEHICKTTSPPLSPSSELPSDRRPKPDIQKCNKNKKISETNCLELNFF